MTQKLFEEIKEKDTLLQRMERKRQSKYEREQEIKWLANQLEKEEHKDWEAGRDKRVNSWWKFMHKKQETSSLQEMKVMHIK